MSPSGQLVSFVVYRTATCSARWRPCYSLRRQKRLGSSCSKAPSRPPIFQGFRRVGSEPVPFFHSLSVCQHPRSSALVPANPGSGRAPNRSLTWPSSLKLSPGKRGGSWLVTERKSARENVRNQAKKRQAEHARSGVVFGQRVFHVVHRCPKTTPDYWRRKLSCGVVLQAKSAHSSERAIVPKAENRQHPLGTTGSPFDIW
jgi:hypothetical protein